MFAGNQKGLCEAGKQFPHFPLIVMCNLGPKTYHINEITDPGLISDIICSETLICWMQHNS